jgi:hypothetical protein
MLPVTQEQFVGVFRVYNEAVWPAQAVLLALAVACVALVALRKGDRAVSAILAMMWLWMGVAYHAAFFSAINPGAWLFAAVFVAGAAVFAWVGVARHGLRFSPRAPWAPMGWALLALALLLYPAAGYFSGQRYPELPTFGLPCPTTIFTLALLQFAQSPPRRVFVVPLAWAAVGGSAAFVLGVPQDLMLPVAGFACAARLLPKRALLT